MTKCVDVLRSALESVEADLILVEASFDRERDPMMAIDAPAWVDNALHTIRRTLNEHSTTEEETPRV